MLADLNNPRVNDLLMSTDTNDTSIYRIVAIDAAANTVILLHRDTEGAWQAITVRRADLATGYTPFRPEIVAGSFWADDKMGVQVLSVFTTPDETSWVVFSHADFPNQPLFYMEDTFRKMFDLAS